MMSDLLDGVVESDAPETALATIETTNFALVFIPGGVEKIVTSIKDEARKQAALLDATKAKDRAALVSLGFKIARSKTTMDEAGKKLNEEANKKINAINTDRRMVREEMDSLKIEVLAPVELYKKTLAEREAANNDAIAAMEAMLDGISDLSSIDIRQRAETIPTFDYAPEFQIKAAKVRASVVAQLTVAYQEAVAREESAEAERIRLAEEANAARLADIAAIQAREEQIAREAAAEATRVAEQKAAQETEMARQAAQALLDAAAEKERERAETMAQMERARILRHEEAIAQIKAAARIGLPQTSVQIQGRINAVAESWDGSQYDWQEFADQARDARATTIETLRALKADVVADERAEQELARIAAHEHALGDFTFIVGSVAGEPSSGDVIQAIGSLQRLHANHDWEEFTDRAVKERADTMATFQAKLAAAQAREKKIADELAETRRLQIVKDEQDRVARETADKKAANDKITANKAHRAAIEREVLNGLILAMSEVHIQDITEAEKIGMAIIAATSKNKINFLSIDYAAPTEKGKLL